MKNTILAALIFFFTNAVYAQVEENMILSAIQPVPDNAGFQMDGYWVWCGSVIKAEDGKYHMFASRWSKSLPFHPGWMLGSEVVRAVSERPEGPFTFVEVVLPARGAEFWDGRSTHNPSITKYKDTYVLYYMGSTHPFDDVKDGSSLNLNSPEATVARSNKRIGMATSKSISGPWVRLDQPILDTKPNTFYSFLTSNPAPLIRSDGSAYLVFKGRGHRDKFPYQTKQVLGIAYAPHFMGPYEVQNEEKNIFPPEQYSEVEDPFLWEDNDGFHLLVKDMSSKLTGEHHAGVLLHSTDAIRWELDENPKAYSRSLLFENGITKKMGQLERPFMLFEDGQPVMLFFATMDGEGGFEKGSRSWNIAVPLKRNSN